MTFEHKKDALAWLKNTLNSRFQTTILRFGFTGIIYALLYIGDVLKDGFKKLEKKK